MKEELTIKRLSHYLTEQLKLCMLHCDNQAKKSEGTYWAGAKYSAESLLELVSEDNLNEALVEHILDGDDCKLNHG